MNVELNKVTHGGFDVERGGRAVEVVIELEWQREDVGAPWELVHHKAHTTDTPSQSVTLDDHELWQAKEKFCP